jgi:hypothetical protein
MCASRRSAAGLVSKRTRAVFGATEEPLALDGLPIANPAAALQHHAAISNIGSEVGLTVYWCDWQCFVFLQTAFRLAERQRCSNIGCEVALTRLDCVWGFRHFGLHC